jgi:general stress protein 26
MDQQQHLYELLKDFDTAMLVTRSDRGQLHARPMALARTPEGDLLFASSIESGTINELVHDARVGVVFQGKGAFASVSGIARIVRDPATIEAVWTEAWRNWFPGGKDDPSIVLIRVEPEVGEYWAAGKTSGQRVIFEAGGEGIRPSRPMRRVG